MNDKVSNTVRVSLRLENAWKNVMTNYGNLQVHEEFVNMALHEKNLPFASQQYRLMLELNAMDEIAMQMRDKIINVATLSFTVPKREFSNKSNLLRNVFLVFITMVLVLLFFSFCSLKK